MRRLQPHDRALDRHGSVRRAAEAVGVAKSTLHDQAKKLGIKPKLGRSRKTSDR